MRKILFREPIHQPTVLEIVIPIVIDIAISEVIDPVKTGVSCGAANEPGSG
jgi:hypothetical protein